MTINDHTEHHRLSEGDLVRGASGELYRVTRPRRLGATQPVETWLEHWSDEYAITMDDSRCRVTSEDEPLFPLTVVQTIPVTDNERRYLAMHARYAADAEMDPRNYATRPHPDGGMQLDERWNTREERRDRWRQIADALHPDPWGTGDGEASDG